MAEEIPNAAPPGAGQVDQEAPASPSPGNPPPVQEIDASTAAANAAGELAAALSGDEANAEALDQVSIDDLLKQANFDDPGSMGMAAPDASDFKLPDFQQVMQDAQVSSIDLLRDVELNVKIELGRARMLVEDVLKLSEGSVVELDKLAGDPVDVFVNDRLVARGEVLVLNDNFCVRVNEIVAGVKEEGL